MAITTDEIKALREKTGISVMQCKKALEEAEGDADKALEILRKKSKDIATKKSERNLGAGSVQAYIHAGDSMGVLLLLACETDFVARNEEFKKLAYDLAMHTAAMNPQYTKEEDISDEERAKAKELFEKEVSESDKPKDIQGKMMEGKLAAYFGERVLLEQAYVKDPNMKVKDLITQAVQKFGENIEVARFTRFAVGE